VENRPADAAPDAPRVGPRDACARIRGQLAQGAPWAGCDAFRDTASRHPADAELLYCGALAHARAGATSEAHALLDRAQAAAPDAPALLSDILSLRGRLWKDQLHRAPDAPDAATIARRARDEYLAAWALLRDPYPGINAATLSMLLGDRAAARDLAQTIAAALAPKLSAAAATTAPGSGATAAAACWDQVTAGEAALLLGHHDEARQRYAAAHALAAGDAGSVATMRRQLVLLARVLPKAAAMLPLVPAADVLAFTGHMVDAPGRAISRFPAALVPAVEAAVREWLARLHRPVFYGSAACGADLIVIEAALAQGAEVNVVLPFDRADFVRTSVETGGPGWLPRFDAALSRATRIVHATGERYLGDDVLFEHAALLVEGLASLRAAQLQTSPRLLCVIDEAAAGQVGGTRSAFERWTQRVGPPEVIDLAALRGGAPAQGARAAADAATRGATRATVGAMAAPVVTDALEPAPEAAAATPASRAPRSLRTMLFADFAGYSRLHDANAAHFQADFWAILARQIESSAVKPLFANTWGDGLYLVFGSPYDAASFALRVVEDFRAVDWTAVGLPETSQIRIALHTGPVFCSFDPIIGRDNYFGSSVTRAARIEPITPPGTVYASEAFAATLAASGQREFVLEYVGQVALAKGYGESRVYGLARR
jgi:hypothetical protein